MLGDWVTLARKVLGWPKICKLAHAFQWEHFSYRRLKLAQILGRLASFSLGRGARRSSAAGPGPRLGETGPLSQSVILKAGGKALRIRIVNGMEVRKKMPTGGSSEPP